jgi:hypothetical protein
MTAHTKKKCAYCGRENGEDAARCCECGTELLTAPSAAEALAPWQRIAVLEHEVEAERLGVELANRKIPHVLITYNDSALDGLFQASHGWGHVEAPGEHRDAVLGLLREIRQGGQDFQADQPGAP